MKYIITLFLSLNLSGYFAYSQTLNVPETIQDHNMWCWDAASKCVLDYFGYHETQCAIANWALNKSDCCGNSDFDWVNECNSGNSPEAIQNIINYFGNIQSIKTSNYLSLTEIKNEIDIGRPFFIIWDQSEIDHVVVGRGISEDEVLYMDPWRGEGLTHDSYNNVKHNTDHNWAATIKLTSIPSNCVDNFENNNSSGNATPVFASPLNNGQSDYPFKASIGYIDDQDWYRVDIGASGTLTVTLSNLPYDYNLELYGPNGVSSPALAGSYNGGTNSEQVTYAHSSGSTTVYAKVYSLNPNNYSTSQCYNIRFTWNPSSGTGGNCNPPSYAPTLTYGSGSCPGTTASASYAPLSWNSVSGASGYQVHVSKYPYGQSCSLSGYNPYNCTALGTNTSLTLSNLEPGMLYSWNVYPTSNCNNSNCNGPSSQTNYFYTIPTITPSNSQTICQGNGVSFYTTPVNVCQGASVSYQWYLNGSPISGAMSTSYYATQVGTYSVGINFSGSSYCSVSTIQSNPVTVSLGQPPGTVSLDGNESACPYTNQSYFASANNATSYNWAFPVEWSTNSQANGYRSVNINNKSGAICARGNNNCGLGPESCKFVTVQNIDRSVEIYGSTLFANASAASYNWLECPSMQTISGAINQSYTPSQAGSYAVHIYQNGCEATSDCYQVLNTGIINISYPTINIYPNPTKDLLNIEGINLSDGKYLMILTNTFGQQLSNEYFKVFNNVTNTSLDIHNLSPGIYFLSITSLNTVMTFKVQKDK